LELLDEPGEWYLDRTTGVLSYMPLPGEDLREVEVIAPVLTELVRLDGNADEGRFVDHVALQGLTLHHADWVLAPEGNSSTQAAVTVPAAVMATGARHCVLEDCEIAHVGTYGVWLGRGCKENRIERNHIHDLGAGGVRIGEDRMAEHDVAEASRNVITNNYIHDGGHVYAAGVGLWLAQSSHNTISHNEIHSFDYSGISIGWNWNEAPNRTHSNTIEYNYVHHVVRGVLSDAGGIYTLGVQPGTVIRNNVFHDIWPYMGSPAMAWGIYFDQGSRGMLVENNLVYHTLTGGLMNTGKPGITVRNNIFALSARHAVWRWHLQDGDPPSVVERNIFYLTQGELFHNDGGRTDDRTKWDTTCTGEPTASRWSSTARSSPIGRPGGWTELAGGRSEVRRPGPVRFPPSARFARTGTRLPADRHQPRGAGRAGRVARVAQAGRVPADGAASAAGPAGAGARRRRLRDDARRPVARAGHGVEEGRGDEVRVTAEKAASGKHSLKVLDAPGLDHAFNPPFVPRAVQVVSDSGRRALLHHLSVRRAQRPACQPRHLGRAVALVELVAPSQPERSGDTRRLASPPRPELAGLCHSSRDGGGIEGIAAERPGWHSLRRNGLAAGHGEASGIGIHVTSPWPPKTRPSRPVNGRTTRQIDTNETRPRFSSTPFPRLFATRDWPPVRRHPHESNLPACEWSAA
jgi:hypothetical protein